MATIDQLAESKLNLTSSSQPTEHTPTQPTLLHSALPTDIWTEILPYIVDANDHLTIHTVCKFFSSTLYSYAVKWVTPDAQCEKCHRTAYINSGNVKYMKDETYKKYKKLTHCNIKWSGVDAVRVRAVVDEVNIVNLDSANSNSDEVNFEPLLRLNGGAVLITCNVPEQDAKFLSFIRQRAELDARLNNTFIIYYTEYENGAPRYYSFHGFNMSRSLSILHTINDICNKANHSHGGALTNLDEVVVDFSAVYPRGIQGAKIVYSSTLDATVQSNEMTDIYLFESSRPARYDYCDSDKMNDAMARLKARCPKLVNIYLHADIKLNPIDFGSLFAPKDVTLWAVGNPDSFNMWRMMIRHDLQVAPMPAILTALVELALCDCK